MGEVQGIDRAAVTRWLEERAVVTAPLRFDVIHGGRSNLTYEVTDDDGRRWVLRRPPLHGVLASAHDVAREHRLVTALAASDVPVPACVGLETGIEVTGAPFYVMEFVAGEVVRDTAAAERALTAETRAAAAQDLVDVLVRLHEVDPDEVGLGDLARKDGYIARQLRRWHGQLEQARTRDLPLLDEVHRRLAADIPEQGRASIVHGDYRLDNLMLDPASGHVRAVLDWELTTLGDPLADLGLLLVYWAGPGDGPSPLADAPSRASGFPDRTGIVERYAASSGRDVADVGYFVAFGRWKLACILEGVHGRYASGAYGSGEPDPAFEGLAEVVDDLAEQAATAAAEAGR